MAVLEIAKYPHTILRRRTNKVTRFGKELKRFVDDLVETMYAAKGVGLAASQVGVLYKIIGLDIGEGFSAIINPRLVYREGEQVDIEGCLSLPGMVGKVKRAQKVIVEGLTPKRESIKLEAQNLLARVLQHEIDHLEGILFIDRVEGTVFAKMDSKGKIAANTKCSYRAGGRKYAERSS
jgi:peptide deformylase